MNFDISGILDQWDYAPGRPVVRRFTGRDGVEKIQLRVDLGLLQMNAEGRPDGKRPLGHASHYDYYLGRLAQHVQVTGGETGFQLTPEDCSKLQHEAFQYHNRYNCLLQLQDYPAVIRDTERNLAVFDFVQKFAQNEDLSWVLQQFRPPLLLIHARARSAAAADANKFDTAIEFIEEGITRIRDFYRDHSRSEQMDQNHEVNILKGWMEEISSRRPLSEREKLERALLEAVTREDYEKAAQVRDALRNLKPTE